MQREAFEAALRLIMTGPGDQPLMRVLALAMDSADCAVAMITAARPDGHQLIVSRGIPLTAYREMLPANPAISRSFARPLVIEDSAELPEWRERVMDYPEAGRWRFVVNMPLPLTMLPFAVTLTCADERIGLARRKNLLGRMEECASIAADELRLIGDIALNTQAVATVEREADVLCQMIEQAQMPIALLDADLAYRAISERLAQMNGLPAADHIGKPVGAAFNGADDALLARLAAVMATGESAIAYPLYAADGTHVYIMDAYRAIAANGERYLIVSLTDRTKTFGRVRELADREHADSPRVVSDFLLSTLVRQRRLMRRKGISYHALARWRSAIRDHQIAALRALKADPGDHFVDQVAQELADGARGLFGRETFRAITAVPCGHGGENCLSARLGRAVAAALDLPWIECFAPLPIDGSSHPRTNIARPPMQRIAAPDMPILLIDDVATSGAHIEEAARKLLETAPAVLPLAWIAA